MLSYTFLSSKTKMILNWWEGVWLFLLSHQTTCFGIWCRHTDCMYIQPKLPCLFPHVAERIHRRRGSSSVRKCFLPNLPNGSTGATFLSERAVLPVPAMALSASVRAWSACRMAASTPARDCRKLWRMCFAWGNNKEQRLARQRQYSIFLGKLLFSEPTDFFGMVLVTSSCSMLHTSIHSSSGTLSNRSNLLNLFVTSTV